MTALQQWFARKLQRRAITICEARTVEQEIDRQGCKGHYAWIRLTGAPDSSFQFESRVRWPEGETLEDAAVLDGVLDELMASDLHSVVTNVSFILEEARWDDVGSSPAAFYEAGRAATRRILGRDEIPGNILWQGNEA